MADLPDLDESNIGMCAYWNAIDDGGVGNVNPEDGLSDGSIGEYTLYDNGWETEDYTSATGRSIKVRAKTDGWIVAYMDRTNEYEESKDSKSDVRGYWDLGNDWSANSAADFVENTLATAIDNVRSEYENSGSMDFSFDDVGLYNFEFTDATNITGLSSSIDSETNNDYGFLYTEGTDLEYLAVAGRATGHVFETDDWSAEVSIEGERVTYKNGSGTTYGSLDGLDTGIVSSSGTEYVVTLNGTKFDCVATGTVVGIWQ